MKIPQDHQQVMVYLIIKDAAAFSSFAQNTFGGHLLIKIGDSTIMFAEATEQFSVQNSHFFIYVEDADITYHKILDGGGRVVTEISDLPYGRSGGVEDPFGNTWWVTGIN